MVLLQYPFVLYIVLKFQLCWSPPVSCFETFFRVICVVWITAKIAPIVGTVHALWGGDGGADNNGGMQDE